MAKPTLTHTLPDGTVATRQTNNPYAFVIVGRADHAAARERLSKPRALDIKNYEYHCRVVECGAGNSYRSEDGRLHTVEQRDYDIAAAYLEGCTTAAEYQAKCAAANLEQHHAQHGDADLGPWVVLSWSATRENATKAMAAHATGSHWTDLRVEPISPAK